MLERFIFISSLFELTTDVIVLGRRGLAGTGLQKKAGLSSTADVRNVTRKIASTANGERSVTSEKNHVRNAWDYRLEAARRQWDEAE
jgi:hypothetical protein